MEKNSCNKVWFFQIYKIFECYLDEVLRRFVIESEHNKELEMLSLNIDDKSIENVFLHQFNSDKEKFIEFIKNSILNLKTSQDEEQREIENILNNRTQEDKEVAFSKIVQIEI